MVSIPGLARSPGEGKGNPLQYSCLGNPMDRGSCGLKELIKTERLNWTELNWATNTLTLGLVYLFSRSVQSLSHVWLFVTPWTTVRQASMTITNSQSLLKHKSIESVMPSNHLILCHPILLLPSVFPSIRVFPISQSSALGGQSIGVSASPSVLPMNIQDWFPLRLTD